jgi:hypothetical protein
MFDLVYVVFGTVVAHGLDADTFFRLVHNNNMLKFANGHLDAGGKFCKAPNHQPPDIAGALATWQRNVADRAGYDAISCQCGMTNGSHAKDTGDYSFLTVMCDGTRLKL